MSAVGRTLTATGVWIVAVPHVSLTEGLSLRDNGERDGEWRGVTGAAVEDFLILHHAWESSSVSPPNDRESTVEKGFFSNFRSKLNGEVGCGF